MRNYLLLFFILLFVTFTEAHAQEKKYLQKVQTLDSTIESLYGVISGEKGEARDWDFFQFLFHPDAKLIPSGKNNEGITDASYMTVEDYVSRAGVWLVENGFFEKEIYRVAETFGCVTHVFSTYESYRSESDTEPFARGINSIQLMNDGRRWWVMNIYWTSETPDNPIPDKYLE